MALHGEILSRNQGSAFPAVYFVSESAFWIELVWCRTVK